MLLAFFVFSSFRAFVIGISRARYSDRADLIFGRCKFAIKGLADNKANSMIKPHGAAIARGDFELGPLEPRLPKAVQLPSILTRQQSLSDGPLVSAAGIML